MSVSGISSSSTNPYQLSVATSLYQQNLKQLGQDLTSGNLSAAQQDFANLQQSPANQSGSSVNHLHNHHRFRAGAGDFTDSNSLLQQLNQLGQDLSAGNLSAAQQAYAALQALPTATTDAQNNLESPVPGNPVSAMA